MNEELKNQLDNMSDEERAKLTRLLSGDGIFNKRRYHIADFVDGKSSLCEELKGKVIEKVVYTRSSVSNYGYGIPLEIEIHFTDSYVLSIEPAGLHNEALQLILK
jgi:hypothetical protein